MIPQESLPPVAQNGAAFTRHDVEELLKRDEPLTQGYRPSVPYWIIEADWAPQMFLLRDVELMCVHPICRNVLSFFKSGIYYAEFWGGPDPADPQGLQGLPISDNQEVDTFVQAQCRSFWQRGVPFAQGGYEYGWIGLENLYSDETGPLPGALAWDGVVQFSPRDTYLLTARSAPIGVRVKNVRPQGPDVPPSGGQVDLFMGTRDVPGKGLWYAHCPRYHSFYGQSQYLGAWRPWRRLAWKDSAETVIDTGIYRYAFTGPIIGYPEEDSQPAASAGAPATTKDSQGNPRRYARDAARQIAEWYKAGAGIGLPTNHYPPELGGGEKWYAKFPEHTIQVEPLIGYAKYLADQISYGIGVPPELLQAAETGSGYSGRAIPLDAFITSQQHIANALLELFVSQVLRPLVRWNFGPDAKFHVEVKPLVTSRKAQANAANVAGTEQQPGMPEDDQSAPGWPRDQDQGIWTPFQNEEGQTGWKSKGGQVRMGANQPGSQRPPLNAGFSLTGIDDERVQAIVEKMLARRIA